MGSHGRNRRETVSSSKQRNRSRRRRSGDSKQRSLWKITEEDISEYLAKKAQRKAARVAKKLKVQNVSGYSNDSNPFGDSNLNEKFLWRKKIEQDVSQGVALDEFSTKQRKRDREKGWRRLKRLKREERAIEKAQHEEEMALLARERAHTEFQDWEKKEEEFHFDQSKVRSEIRLCECRMKPIDILCNHLSGSDDSDLELNEPYMVFNGLTVKEMEELHEDIQMYLDLDRSTPMHIEYWEALIVVCNWELAEAQKKDALDRARVRGEEPPAELLAEERGLHSSIELDVRNLLQGKTHSFLKEIHAKMLRKHLQRVEQPLDGGDKFETNHDLRSEEEDIQLQNDNNRNFSPELISREEAQEAEEEPGSFSPELLHVL
ncbi:hypothetical protein Patl1_27173 [Pistacia atlantica]|uniref:Uncharacterized protein n=1 Tax=Pistacia atlantica TaxID=434234 RepID=A0ACC1BCJ0_9ROSI|nr:hypothetical protein Patl1_27173 [Pistacia atlantica]